MRALLLLLTISFGSFAQEFIQCDFAITNNESDFSEFEKSRVSFLWKLNDTERREKRFKMYKVRLYPGTKKMYEHQILAFDIDAKGSFTKKLQEKNIPFDLKELKDELVVDIDRIYTDMHVLLRTDFNHWKFSMGGPYTTQVTHEFNFLTPLYTEVYFEKIKKVLFGPNKQIIERTVVPIYFSCQKLDTSYVNQTDLIEKADTIYSPQAGEINTAIEN